MRADALVHALLVDCQVDVSGMSSEDVKKAGFAEVEAIWLQPTHQPSPNEARAAGEEGRRDYFHDFDDMWTAKEEDARRKKEAQDKEAQRQSARRKKVRW